LNWQEQHRTEFSSGSFEDKSTITATGLCFEPIWDSQNRWVCGPCPVSGIPNNQKKQRFENWVFFRLQVREENICSVLYMYPFLT
jgi:hypothetical protein